MRRTVHTRTAQLLVKDEEEEARVGRASKSSARAVLSGESSIALFSSRISRGSELRK